MKLANGWLLPSTCLCFPWLFVSMESAICWNDCFVIPRSFATRSWWCTTGLIYQEFEELLNISVEDSLNAHAPFSRNRTGLLHGNKLRTIGFCDWMLMNFPASH